MRHRCRGVSASSGVVTAGRLSFYGNLSKKRPVSPIPLHAHAAARPPAAAMSAPASPFTAGKKVANSRAAGRPGARKVQTPAAAVKSHHSAAHAAATAAAAAAAAAAAYRGFPMQQAFMGGKALPLSSLRPPRSRDFWEAALFSKHNATAPLTFDPDPLFSQVTLRATPRRRHTTRRKL